MHWSFSDNHSAGVGNKGCLLLEHQDPGTELHLKCAHQLCPVIPANPCANISQSLDSSFHLATFYINASQGQLKKIIKFFLGQMGDLAHWEVVFLIWSCELFCLGSWDDWVTLAEQTKMFHAVPWGRWNTSIYSAELLHLWMKSVSGNEGSVTAWGVQCSGEWRFLSQGRRSFQQAVQLGSRAKSILQGELRLTVVSCFVSGCAET